MAQEQTPQHNIVLFSGDNFYTPIIYNFLKSEFNISYVVIENPSSKLKIIKKRFLRFGFLIVLGQILFRVLVVPLLKRVSEKRIQDSKDIYGMDEEPIEPSKIKNVTSLNSEELVSMLKETRPDLIVIAYANRIISEKTLNQVPTKFINMHGGINPLYRGVHGAYWALVEKNYEACGVIIHYIDSGIDTGKILAQGTTQISQKDNIYTYPLLLLARGIPLLKNSIQAILEDRVEFPEPPKGKSKYWSHPTIWEYIEKFESQFAEYCECAAGVTTTSGTTAIHLALKSLGVGPGDEVLAPAFTMVGSVYPIVQCGASPVFVDCEPDTGNKDIQDLECKITSSTKVILIVHIYDHPADMDPICDLARSRSLKIVEDAAEAHGALYKGRKAGSLGDVGCFSFYANKIITTGEGGMVASNDMALIRKARQLKDLAHGKIRFTHNLPEAFNYRMTNIQAAIGLGQLERIEDTIKKKLIMRNNIRVN